MTRRMINNKCIPIQPKPIKNSCRCLIKGNIKVFHHCFQYLLDKTTNSEIDIFNITKGSTILIKRNSDAMLLWSVRIMMKREKWLKQSLWERTYILCFMEWCTFITGMKISKILQAQEVRIMLKIKAIQNGKFPLYIHTALINNNVFATIFDHLVYARYYKKYFITYFVCIL